jgi:hypothetical protein
MTKSEMRSGRGEEVSGVFVCSKAFTGSVVL